ncbi:MAG: hypothetical protein JNK48_30980 [Bryobacterales bacterium]|nr:hypothetical protein [Bryobacterales bacterium]
MWPYLVGVEIYSRIHLDEVEARLALLGANRVISGVWLLRSDHTPDALRMALRTVLDEWESFFVVPVEEEFYGENIGVRPY